LLRVPNEGGRAAALGRVPTTGHRVRRTRRRIVMLGDRSRTGANLIACSESRLRNDPPARGRVLERLIVTVVLIGIGLGELRDRAIEYVRGAEVGADGDPVRRRTRGAHRR